MDNLPCGDQTTPVSVSLDVCILIDATSSMASSFPQAKAFSEALLSKMRSRNDLQYSRIAVVAYRDHGDGPPDVLDFVSESAKAKAFMGTLAARGGGDIPEDVQGGLLRALSLSWGPDAAVKEGEVKLLVHIADAPAHGPYHAFRDDHPEKVGAPGARLEDLMAQCARRGINYCFVAVNDSADGLQKMVGAMKGAFNAAPPRMGTKNFMNFPMTHDVTDLARQLCRVAEESVKFASKSWKSPTVAMALKKNAAAAGGGGGGGGFNASVTMEFLNTPGRSSGDPV
jgi:hypothetical protein